MSAHLEAARKAMSLKDKAEQVNAQMVKGYELRLKPNNTLAVHSHENGELFIIPDWAHRDVEVLQNCSYAMIHAYRIGCNLTAAQYGDYDTGEV